MALDQLPTDALDFAGGTGVYDYVANAVGDYSILTQLKSQLWAVLVSLTWSGVVAAVSFKIVDAVIGLRVAEDQERKGRCSFRGRCFPRADIRNDIGL